ncbi:MAG: hypothetical protein V7635_1749 [Arthrobacter sp.]
MPLQAGRGRCEQPCQQHEGETQTASPNGAAGGGSGPHFLIMSQRWRPAGAPGSSPDGPPVIHMATRRLPAPAGCA